MKKRMLSILLCLTLILSLMPGTVWADGAVETVKLFGVPFLNEVSGNMSVPLDAADGIICGEYGAGEYSVSSITVLTYDEEAGEFVSNDSEVYEEGKEYVVLLTVTASEDAYFDDDTEVKVYSSYDQSEDISIQSLSVDESGSSLSFEIAQGEAAEALEDIGEDISVYVTEPALGEVPSVPDDYDESEEDPKYSVSFGTWKNAENGEEAGLFEGGTYFLDIMITASEGYLFGEETTVSVNGNTEFNGSEDYSRTVLYIRLWKTLSGYRINVLETENGYITVMVDGVETAFAEAGSLVNVILVPNENCAVDEVTVSMSATGETVAVSESETENQFSFVMPEADVDVSAVFAAQKETVLTFSEETYTVEAAEDASVTGSVTLETEDGEVISDETIELYLNEEALEVGTTDENGMVFFTVDVSSGLFELGDYTLKAVFNGTALNAASEAVSTISILGTKLSVPEAVFNATGSDSGILTGVSEGMRYSFDGVNYTEITGDEYTVSGVTAGTLYIVSAGDRHLTLDSDAQEIILSQAAAPELTCTDCTTADNNNGSILGVDESMEYMKEGNAELWLGCFGTSIDLLTPGTYLVRVKGSGTTLYSAPVSIEIRPFESAQYSIVYVLNGGVINDAEYPVVYSTGVYTNLPMDVTRDGYDFTGWYRDANLANPMNDKIGPTESGDLTLYAGWNVKETESSTEEPTTESTTEEPTTESTTEEPTTESTTEAPTTESTTEESTTESTTEESTAESTTAESTTESTTAESTTESTTEPTSSSTEAPTTVVPSPSEVPSTSVDPTWWQPTVAPSQENAATTQSIPVETTSPVPETPQTTVTESPSATLETLAPTQEETEEEKEEREKRTMSTTQIILWIALGFVVVAIILAVVIYIRESKKNRARRNKKRDMFR